MKEFLPKTDYVDILPNDDITDINEEFESIITEFEELDPLRTDQLKEIFLRLFNCINMTDDSEVDLLITDSVYPIDTDRGLVIVNNNDNKNIKINTRITSKKITALNLNMFLIFNLKDQYSGDLNISVDGLPTVPLRTVDSDGNIVELQKNDLNKNSYVFGWYDGTNIIINVDSSLNNIEKINEYIGCRYSSSRINNVIDTIQNDEFRVVGLAGSTHNHFNTPSPFNFTLSTNAVDGVYKQDDFTSPNTPSGTLAKSIIMPLTGYYKIDYNIKYTNSNVEFGIYKKDTTRSDYNFTEGVYNQTAVLSTILNSEGNNTRTDYISGTVYLEQNDELFGIITSKNSGITIIQDFTTISYIGE